MMNKLMISLAASTLITTCAIANDNNNIKKLDNIKVTAQRTEQSLGDINRNISLIDNETIERRQSINLPELMNEQVGITFAPDGMQSGQVVIRGFSTQSFRAPLFINGDRFRGRNTLEYMLLDPNQVERIEIIHGPASSLYGTDSFGGIVNVITKRATGDINAPFHMTDSYYNVEYQSVNEGISQRLQLGGIGDGFDVLFGLNHRKGEDYDSPEGTIPNSDFKSRGYDLRMGYTIDGNHRIELINKYAKINRGRAGGQFGAPGAGNAPGQLQRQQREEPMKEKYTSLGYSGKIESLGISSLEASLYKRRVDTHVNVVPNLNNPSTFVDVYVNGPTVYGGKLIALKPLEKSGLTSTYGIDWYNEIRDSKEKSVKGKTRVKDSPEAKQLNIGAFMLHEYDFGNDFILSGSLRHDYIKTSLDTSFISDPTTKNLFDNAGDTKNNKTTGGIGAIYAITPNIDILGNINTSFRAPSTTEVSAVGTGVSKDFYIPNNSLEPEEGVTYEIGARYSNDKISSNLTLFTSKYDNLISVQRTTYNNQSAKQVQNIGESKISGVEFDIDYTINEAFNLKTNIGYLKGTNEITNKPLPQIMPLNGFVSLKYAPPSINDYYVELTTQWAKKRTRVDENTERQRDGYVVPNLYTGFNLKKVASFKRIDFNFGIENIFDKKYSMSTVPENISYDISKTNPLIQPGRNFKLSISARF